MGATTDTQTLHGMMVEFETPEALIDGLRRTRDAGYRSFDAFTPFPIHDVCELVADHKPSKVPLLVLCGGLTGASLGFGFQTWAMGVSYPMNIGGRPLFSWPAFIPVTFELTILLSAFCAVFGMFILNGLPRPHHPVFAVEGFERASTDRYFLLIEGKDPQFEPEAARSFLASLGGGEVRDVAP